MKYVVYGSPRCAYCNSAKDLLDHKGLEYEYRDISQNEEWKEFLMSSGFRTVPQIFVEGGAEKPYIGGYDSLCAHLQSS